MLKHFNKPTYTSLGTALTDIRKELESLQPKDSSDIVWSHTNTGMSASVRINRSGNGMPTESTTEENTVQTTSDTGYNSYFKIVDMTETVNNTTMYKFAVKDGAGRTYNRCKVNNKVFDIPHYTSETVTQTVLIALRFSSAENGVTIQVRKELELPDDTSEHSWYQLGMFIIDNNDIRVQQDHLTGVAQMFWYDICGD
jgi:hypothetical protein